MPPTTQPILTFLQYIMDSFIEQAHAQKFVKIDQPKPFFFCMNCIFVYAYTIRLFLGKSTLSTQFSTGFV